MDMQQVLFCPTLTHSSVFYQRQYSCYNFCISNCGTDEVRMNLWHESIAARGSAEIASVLLKYIGDKYRVLEEGEERHLVIWSDRCVGENNDWRIVTLCHYLVQCQYFTTAEQKFLCSGHSSLPCDRHFALIEKRKKVSKVYVPNMWKDVIENARESKPFEVTPLCQEDFKDLQRIENSITRNPNLKITQYMWFKYSHDHPSSVAVRATHNTLQPWSSFSICNRPNVQQPIMQDFPLLYSEPLKVTFEKKENLMDMAEFIPLRYIQFDQNLKAEGKT